MSSVRTWWLALGGGAAIAAVVGVGVVMAQSPTPEKASPSAVPGTSTGTFRSNEDATHEAGEDPTREAAEDSGQFRGGKHGGPGMHKPNEDATHEAGESSEREATENAEASATPSPGN